MCAPDRGQQSSPIEQHPYLPSLPFTKLITPIEHLDQELIINIRVAIII